MHDLGGNKRVLYRCWGLHGYWRLMLWLIGNITMGEVGYVIATVLKVVDGEGLSYATSFKEGKGILGLSIVNL